MYSLFTLQAGARWFTDAESAFESVDFALLVGARPRGPGMERKDLLAANASIFRSQVWELTPTQTLTRLGAAGGLDFVWLSPLRS